MNGVKPLTAFSVSYLNKLGKYYDTMESAKTCCFHLQWSKLETLENSKSSSSYFILVAVWFYIRMYVLNMLLCPRVAFLILYTNYHGIKESNSFIPISYYVKKGKGKMWRVEWTQSGKWIERVRIK